MERFDLVSDDKYSCNDRFRDLGTYLKQYWRRYDDDCGGVIGNSVFGLFGGGTEELLLLSPIVKRLNRFAALIESSE